MWEDSSHTAGGDRLPAVHPWPTFPIPSLPEISLSKTNYTGIIIVSNDFMSEFDLQMHGLQYRLNKMGRLILVKDVADNGMN